MPQQLPLFPLGTVLVPGQPLPLRVFEERYRLLVRELLAQPAGTPRRFGVVAIRSGHEVGAGRLPELYEVGCTAEVDAVHPHPDGRFDLSTTGGVRFRLREVDASRPYLVGNVDLLAERSGAEAARLAAVVRSSYDGYADVLAQLGLGGREPRALPDDPIALSYAVAGALLIDLPERQGLLAAPDAHRRLSAERALLRRETALLRHLSAAPAGALMRLPTPSLN